MMSDIELQPAFLLHQRPYRDSSQLLEVLTRDCGRLGVVARGSRGPRSRSRGMLRPFAPLLLSFRLRSELGTLRSVEPGGPPVRLSGQRLFAAFYVNELLLRLVQRDDPYPVLFDIYLATIAGLAEAAPEPWLRRFEKRLLEELGYGLSLIHEADTGARVEDRAWYDYRLGHGPVRVQSAQHGQLVIRGATLTALAADRLEDDTGLREARRVLRAALSVQLGDRPLQTRKVLRAMKPA